LLFSKTLYGKKTEGQFLKVACAPVCNIRSDWPTLHELFAAQLPLTGPSTVT